MRYSELSEVRRNPEKNPKINPIEVIKDYLGRNELYYMSYTAIDKIGLNPRSGYNTPIGIYSYPINDRMVDSIIASDNMSRVPYMGELPYVWIFEPKNRERGLIIDEYTAEDYDNDVDTLFRYIDKKDSRISAAFDEARNYAELDSRKQFSAGYIWNFTRILAKLLTRSESIYSYNGTILNIGDSVTEINNTNVAKIIDVYPDEKEYEIEYANGENFFVKFNEVKPVNNESIVLEYKPESIRAKTDSVMWTHLLYRVLGYDYVDDSSGTGLIHANEPRQAVFFNSSVIKVLDRINNKDRDNDVSISSVLSELKKPEDMENIDQSIIVAVFNKLLKNKVPNISSQIPIRFMGHLVVNSSKLQARLMINDPNFADYFKNINPDTISIMDNYIIKAIQNIPSGNMENRHIFPIFNYFNRFRIGKWPEGERAILNKAYNDNNAALIIEYCYRVRRTPWPEAEFIILKNPSSIPSYAEKILRKRWPDGERVLSKIDPVRGEWILDMYASEFNIDIKDIGKI